MTEEHCSEVPGSTSQPLHLARLFHACPLPGPWGCLHWSIQADGRDALPQIQVQGKAWAPTTDPNLRGQPVPGDPGHRTLRDPQGSPQPAQPLPSHSALRSLPPPLLQEPTTDSRRFRECPTPTRHPLSLRSLLMLQGREARRKGRKHWAGVVTSGSMRFSPGTGQSHKKHFRVKGRDEDSAPC